MEVSRHHSDQLREVTILLVSIKLSWIASLLSFFIFALPAYADAYRSSEWSDLPPAGKAAWAALLHHYDGHFQIADPHFFLSGSPRNIEQEFLSAQTLLTAGTDLICRFPARYTWIQGLLGRDSRALSQCSELNEYLHNVPAKSISLIYSSENVSKPSSMMGHILLKIDGESSGTRKSHAISFYTELNSVNVPKIIFDSLVSGKEGFFVLTPYAEKRAFYLQQEGRNIWEYQLALSPEAVRLIMLHMWELKQTRLDYFFDDYNCATLTANLLAVADALLTRRSSHWLSPVDVVKQVNAAGLVAQTRIETAPKWRARMLSDALSKQQTAAVVNFMGTKEFQPPLEHYSAPDQYLMLKLAEEYHRADEDKIPTDDMPEKAQRQLEVLENEFDIDLSEYKSPLRTPPDSQWSIGGQSFAGNYWARLSYLPVAHEIDDDNRQYFTENALKLAYVSVLLKEDRVKLENFTLYEATSLNPSDPWLGGMSGHIHIGFRQAFDDDLHRRLNFDISGGVGKSYQPVRQMAVYGLAVAGIGVSSDARFAYLAPEAGLIINEKFDMKTSLRLRYSLNELDNAEGLWQLSLSQMKFFKNDFSLRLHYQSIFNEDHREQLVQIDLKRYF